MKNGDKVRDTTTGFTGTVVGIADWISGCVRAAVQSGELHEGMPVEEQWFDVDRLEVQESKPRPPVTPSGGPQRDPKRSF